MARTRRGRGALTSSLAVVGAVGAAIALVALIAWLQGDTGKRASTSSTTSTSVLGKKAAAERAASQAWSAEAQAAFGGEGITQRVTDLAKGAHDWLAGTLPQDQFKARLDDDLTAFTNTRDAVAKLRPYPYDSRVNDLYARTAALYVDSVKVYEAALGAPAGDVRTQHDLLARRLRLLGDRVFDRGQALIDPHLYDPPTPDVEVRKPEEVPNWVAEGLAAGPPLDAAPPPPASQPELRQATRPQQSLASWVIAVERAGVPTTGDLRGIIDAGDATRLAGVATDLVRAAEKLRTAPDPKGDREESARYRLGVLVLADAARTAQLNPSLADVARDILAVGAGLATIP